jgi:hypothetical protein
MNQPNKPSPNDKTIHLRAVFTIGVRGCRGGLIQQLHSQSQQPEDVNPDGRDPKKPE